MAMIDCPHPQLCGVRRQHHDDKASLHECQRRGAAAASRVGEMETMTSVLSAAERTEDFSPGESRYLSAYASTELVETDALGPEGQVGLDAYAVTIEGAGDQSMTTPYWVSTGDAPPTAREVVRSLILDHDQMRRYGSDWQSWSAQHNLSPMAGRSEWDRVQQGVEGLQNVLGADFDQVAAAARQEKQYEATLITISGLSQEADEAISRVLGSRPIEQIISARPIDLMVDMMMSDEQRAVELHEVSAWQVKQVDQWSIAQRRRRSAGY